MGRAKTRRFMPVHLQEDGASPEGILTCEGCGLPAIANIGVRVCVRCSYIVACKLYHFDGDGHLHCDAPPDYHSREAMLKRLNKFQIKDGK